MLEFKTINEVLIIESSLLDRNLKQHVCNKLKDIIEEKKKKKKYTKKYGFILKAENVVILQSLIEMECNKFFIEYRATVLDPSPGKVYSSMYTLDIASQNGKYCAIVSIEDTFHILIKNGFINSETNRYEFPSCSCFLLKEQFIRLDNIVIKSVEYNNGSCYPIGEHVHQ